MGGRLIECWGKYTVFFNRYCKKILAALVHFREKVLSFSYISGSIVNHFYSTQGRMTLNRLGGKKYHILLAKQRVKHPLIKRTDCASNKFSSD